MKFKYINNRYCCGDSNSLPLYYIGHFLVEESSLFWVKFALNEESGCCSTNTSCLCRDDDYIEITSSYEKDEDFDDDTIVRCGRILIPEFVKLVESWHKLRIDVPLWLSTASRPLAYYLFCWTSQKRTIMQQVDYMSNQVSV